MIRRAAFAAALLVGSACSAQPQRNAGEPAPASSAAPRTLPRNAPDTGIRNVPATTGKANLAETPPPFAVTPIGSFTEPFAMAFLPDGALLVTEKAGKLKIRTGAGVFDIDHVPAVAAGGQGGLLDVAVAPDFATSGLVYLTYAEPGPGGSQLALARGRLVRMTPRCARCGSPWQFPEKPAVVWRSGASGPGGQFGATIAFAPDGASLFLSSGERQRFSPAQDPQQRLGKILRLTLDGKAWPGNPDYRAGGARAETWSSGHRNPYGLAFTPDGRLWEEEMGPRGGDELNLIVAGRNYGWPIVSNGDNYSGRPIPDHPSRPDLAAPTLWWNPSISPGGMIVYSGAMFPAYRSNLFIAALSGAALIRVVPDGAGARAVEQWRFGQRIRDVAQAPDGSIWLLEDEGGLVRLTPEAR